MGFLFQFCLKKCNLWNANFFVLEIVIFASTMLWNIYLILVFKKSLLTISRELYKEITRTLLIRRKIKNAFM
jgi:hypothetical protein